jgi:hypothetical protein
MLRFFKYDYAVIVCQGAAIVLTFDWKPESLEEVAHKVAWAAVKKEYEKDRRTGAWKRKET